MPFLEILTSYGRRDKVEVSQNTLIIHVLEEICAKRNLDVNNCILMHNKNKVDLSVKFGTSNLINNSKVELIDKEQSQVNNTVNITLQLPSNQRLVYLFNSTDNLWKIMEEFGRLNTNLESDLFPHREQNVHHVIINVNDQIVGEYCLRNTKLCQLGIREGRILLKLTFKEFSPEEILNVKQALDSRTKKLEELKSLAKAKLDKSVSQTCNVPVCAPITHPVPATAEQVPIMSHAAESHGPDVSAYDGFMSVFRDPTNQRSIFDSDESPRHHQPTTDHRTLGEMLGMSLDTSANQPAPMQDYSQFKFPDLPANTPIEGTSHNTTDEAAAAMSMQDRDSVLFKRTITATEIPSQDDDDLPDEFFRFTEEDAKLYLTRLKEQNEALLMTKEYREKLRKDKFSIYRCCIIQFHFPDSYILQAIFYPDETVNSLYQYIDEYLRCSVKSIKYQLYTTPPKTLLSDRTRTLLHSDLVPMSKVYVSLPISQMFQGDLSTFVTEDGESKARESINKWKFMNYSDQSEAVNLTNDNREPIKSSQQIKTGTSSTAALGYSSRQPRELKQVPKWFKPGK